MMTVGRNKPDKNKTGIPGIERSMRGDAEEEIAQSPKLPPDLEGQTPDQLIHELRVHQIELKTQADELRRTHLELTDARDKYLDLYEFAPVGYFTLNEKAVITHVNLSGAKLLGVGRGKLINHGLGQFIDPGDRDLWDRYFAGVRGHGEKKTCTLILLRKDGVTFPARLEGVRTTGRDGVITVRIAISDITDIRDAGVAVTDSEKRFRLLFNSGRDAIAVHKMGKDGQPTHFIQVNDIACERLGYTREEMLKLSPQDIDAPDRSAQMPAIINTLLKTSHVLFETEHIAKDGHRIPVEVSTVLFQLDDDQATMSVARDITERKRVEDKLRESEEKYRLIAENTADIIWVFDMGLHLTYISSSVKKMRGFTVDEVMGQTLDQMMTPGSVAGVIKLFDEEMTLEASGNAVQDRPIIIETDDYCKDGSIIRVENTIRLLRKADGHPYAILGVSHDITERKRAEEALRESEHFLGSILESTPNLIYIYNLDEHRNMFSNREIVDFLGYSPGQIQSLGSALFKNILHPDDAQMVALHHARLKTANDREIMECEYRMKHADGTWRVLHSRDIPFFRDQTGKITQILGSAEDITERKEAENMIRSGLAEKEILLREVHHRVKNNLAGIISLIGLQAASLTDPVSISLLKDLETRIRSMALVHESLYQTKDLAQVSFATYTENLTGHLSQVYSTSPSVRYRIEMGDTTMPIETAIPCGLVMTEIITNSLKYAFPPTFSCKDQRGEPCTITLTLQHENSDYLLTISDNGIGMPDGPEVTVTHSLGLYLIRLIVQHQLRGTLDISTDKGTSYTIRFPEPAIKEEKPGEKI